MKRESQTRLDRSKIGLGVLLLWLVAAAPQGSAARPASAPMMGTPRLVAQFVFEDFDGDRKPDFAVVQTGQGDSGTTQYWIALRLSSGPRTAMGITAPSGGLQITTQDVNADDFPDIVVTTLLTHQPVAVLLNDGQGNFRTSNPSLFPQAFDTSTGNGTIQSAQISDSNAAFLFRYSDQDCPRRASVDSPRIAQLLQRVSRRYRLAGSACRLLSRAPPAAAL